MMNTETRSSTMSPLMTQPYGTNVFNEMDIDTLYDLVAGNPKFVQAAETEARERYVVVSYELPAIHAIAQDRVLLFGIATHDLKVNPKAADQVAFLQDYVNWAADVLKHPGMSFFNKTSVGSVLWKSHSYVENALSTVLRMEAKTKDGKFLEVKGMNTYWAGLETALRVVGDLWAESRSTGFAEALGGREFQQRTFDLHQRLGSVVTGSGAKWIANMTPVMVHEGREYPAVWLKN